MMETFEDRVIKYKKFLVGLSLRDLAIEAIRVSGDFEVGSLAFNALIERIDAIQNDFNQLKDLLGIVGIYRGK